MLLPLSGALLGLGSAPAAPPMDERTRPDPLQRKERTTFQTNQPYRDRIHLGGDVAIVYGFNRDMPGRVRSWREKGYRVHLMTGVSWGEYQDYLYGRFDGKNHEDEAQTRRDGTKVSHGGDIYYMSPGPSYGRYLAAGVERALEAGVGAVHLEEPEFWVAGGYEPSFQREWQAFYKEPWLPQHTSVDAQWRTSKLKYFLYKRALQTVFDAVQSWNRAHGKRVRCYVPTHSLLNYAHWGIVSPESSLATLKGCDGYIAQVWTGTSRTPNIYRGVKKERTFETAFLEYGAMQNLVRATGRTVWYLNDPVEDDPNHDWGDYRRNWESTLVASLLQPDVAKYEIAPWPERIFEDKYPAEGNSKQRIGIPAPYATELQTVFNALNDMSEWKASWSGVAKGIGIVVSDSLMFERADPVVSDMDMGHFYGLAMPLVKRGIPVEPVQLETIGTRGTIDRYRVLLMTYRGQKPLSPEGHKVIAAWVRRGGKLIFVDDDGDPYNAVREWWNTGANHFKTPREDLFARLGVGGESKRTVGRGELLWFRNDPSWLAGNPLGEDLVRVFLKEAGFAPSARAGFVLRRGPYIAAAGLDESPAPTPEPLKGRFVSLFDPQLRVRSEVVLAPGSRHLLADLDRWPADRPLVASACRSFRLPNGPDGALRYRLEGIAVTRAVVLLRLPRAPKEATIGGESLGIEYHPREGLLRLVFTNDPHPRELVVRR